MGSPIRDGAGETARAGPAGTIPEELLLDVGIAVFDAPGSSLDGDAEESAFQNDEVLRAERNYLPYVIGERLQEAGTWGAVRVIPRPRPAIDVTLTGTIMQSDGESLTFRAQATDARGVVWFDNEYRVVAASGAYDEGEESGDPFAPAYARLAADMAASLRELTLDDLARIRAVAEVAFGHSLVPEAFARHVEPKREGGHELRRLPADEDPMLARVRDIRQREHLFIDQVNEYYDDFSASIEGPYQEWRRQAFSSRRVQRELKLKADAYVLLGSARIVAGLARMDHDLPGRLGFDWVARGMGLIRGADTSEEKIRDSSESLREIGSSTTASLLPHTTSLENRTTSLQHGVDGRYDQLRTILGRLYREEIGLPRDPSGLAPREEEQPSGSAAAVANRLVVDPLAESASAALTTTEVTRLERQTTDAKDEIRAGNVQAAINMLEQILDETEELGTQAVARVYTLLALGHLAQSDDRRALSAFNHVVNRACTNICRSETARGKERRRHFNPIRPTVRGFIAAAQEEIHYGDFDYAIEMLNDLVGNPLASPPSTMRRDVAKSLGVFALRPSERAAAYQALARAYVGKQDYKAASDVYERILGMGSRVPPWHRDISNESLALIYFSRRDYKKSVEYQRAWLGTANWVGEACPKVCPSDPGA
ncbi:MAG: hypothetical protein OXH68_03850 [Gammaproteobacteria bacterium]|nr:hypothetical protein [Gammaproteobacteria bacterium]